METPTTKVMKEPTTVPAAGEELEKKPDLPKRLTDIKNLQFMQVRLKSETAGCQVMHRNPKAHKAENGRLNKPKATGIYLWEMYIGQY